MTRWTTPVIGSVVLLAGTFDLRVGAYLSVLGRAGNLLLLGFSWFRLRARVGTPTPDRLRTCRSDG